MTKRIIQTLCIAALIIGTQSCKKESKTETPTPQVKQKSKLELLCQNWILEETYENDVKKTSGGTDKYIFTRQGKFQFYYNNSWMDIGTFGFTGKDSTAISMLFSGTSTPTTMTIKELSETKFSKEFMVSGTKYLYKYKR